MCVVCGVYVVCGLADIQVVSVHSLDLHRDPSNRHANGHATDAKEATSVKTSTRRAHANPAFATIHKCIHQCIQ